MWHSAFQQIIFRPAPGMMGNPASLWWVGGPRVGGLSSRSCCCVPPARILGRALARGQAVGNVQDQNKILTHVTPKSNLKERPARPRGPARHGPRAATSRPRVTLAVTGVERAATRAFERPVPLSEFVESGPVAHRTVARCGSLARLQMNAGHRLRAVTSAACSDASA